MALPGSVALPYRWIDQSLIVAAQAGAGPPRRVRLEASVWAKFRETAPNGYVPAPGALREPGVSH